MKQNQAHDNYRPGDSYKNSSFTVQSQYYWLHNLSISHLTHPSTKLHLHTHLLSVQVYRVACKEWEGKTTDWLTDWSRYTTKTKCFDLDDWESQASKLRKI